MSDKDKKSSKKGDLSRRGFFRVAGGAAATAAVSGNPAAMASAAQKVSRTATAGIITKIAQIGGFPINDIRGILPSISKENSEAEIANITTAMRERLMGGGIFQRHQTIKVEYEGDERWNEIYAGKISIREELNTLEALNRLPKDIPLLDLLSEETLKALYGDKEEFDSAPNVRISRDLRKLIAPLCSETTTAPDIVESFMGFFRKCAEHAIENPDDFDFTEDMDNGYKWERKEIGGHSTQDVIIKILRNHASDDSNEYDLLDRLKKSNKAWKSKKLDQAWDLRLERDAKIRADNEAKKAADYAKEKAERLKYKLEQEARKRIALENPEKRSERVMNLEHLEGDNYFVHTAPRDGYEELPIPEHEDWLCWLQTFNPEAKAEDISVTANGKIVSIPQKAENAKALQALWRTASKNSRFTVKLPNNRIGIDLNQQPKEGLPVKEMPYADTDASINLNIEITEISAADILNVNNEDTKIEEDDEKDLSISKFFRNASERETDELTGLKTPAGMLPELEKEMKYRKSAGYHDDEGKIIAAHIDIKQFKRINDEYGHATGDLILTELAQRINDTFRHQAVIGRVQCDEILLLFHRKGQTKDRTDKDIRAAIGGKAPIPFSQDGKLRQLGVTASVGIASPMAKVINFEARQKSLSKKHMALAA
ncbi:MAG: diguanylate cyclase [Pseudomonadota bacterium]